MLRSQSDSLPFEIIIEECTFEHWPALHSFAFGEWQDKWIIITGRINGLHGFDPETAFPMEGANDQIWILDPVTGTSVGTDMTALDSSLISPLKSTNTQYIQIDWHLYIFGGYGYDEALEKYITFPTIIAV